MNWKVFLVLAVLAIAALFVVYRIYNKPHKDISASKVDFELNLSTLIDEFSADATVANKKYVDKVLMLEANMTTIEDGQPVHLFLSDGGMGIANCEMIDNSTDFFKEDETIKVKGLFVGYDDLIEPTITMKKCSILN